MLRYQIDEIEDAGLSIGEDISIAEELKRLDSFEHIDKVLGSCYDAFYNGRQPLLDTINSIKVEVNDLVKYDTELKEVSQEEADKKIATLGITANEYVINPLVSDTLNNTKPKADTYKDTQDYDASRELAYRNIEKLQPFYNKEWIVNQGNKIQLVLNY